MVVKLEPDLSKVGDNVRRLSKKINNHFDDLDLTGVKPKDIERRTLIGEEIKYMGEYLNKVSVLWNEWMDHEELSGEVFKAFDKAHKEGKKDVEGAGN